MSEETIPQMREQIDDLQKKLKAAEKSTADLVKENRVLKARDVFREQGFAASVAELFAAQNPEGDITPEAVVSFVEKYGVGKPAVAATTEVEEAGTKSTEGSGSGTAPGTPDLAGLSRGGSRAGEGGAGGATLEPMTQKAWQDLYATDKAAARLAVAKGQVQISRDNVFADTKSAPGVNPFFSATQK